MARIDGLRAAIEKYDDALIQYVTGFKSQRDDAKTMIAKADTFVALCETIRSEQREQLNRTVKLGQALVADHIGKVEGRRGTGKIADRGAGGGKGVFPQPRPGPPDKPSRADRYAAYQSKCLEGKLQGGGQGEVGDVIVAITGYHTAFSETMPI